MPVIAGAVVSVETDGSFSYSTTVGSIWTPGFYVITVTDSNGLTGTWTFSVGGKTA